MDSKPDDKTDSGDDAADELATDAAFDADDVVAAPPTKPSKLPLLVSLVALIAALAALGVVGLQMGSDEPVVADDGSAAQLAELADRIAAGDSRAADSQATLQTLRQSVATIEQRIAQLAASDDVVESDVDALERRFQQQLTAIESVPGRVASIERSMSTLRGISTGARDAWLLAQAEYYLQVANSELQLANNPDVAVKALEMADERLLTISDPGLTDVRRTLSAELRALESMPKPDIAGAAVTLASLARVVDSLPIRRQLLTKQPAESDGAEADDAEALSGTDRAMATLRDAFSGIVSVRRTDEEAVPLIAPEAVYFLRANLSLQLQAARLALLQGNQTLFRQSLDDVELWLRDYYDMESTPVRSALATIDEVRTGMLIEPAPDISESLRLLRQYIAFENAGQPETRPAPARSTPPAAAAPPPQTAPESDPEPEPEPAAAPETANEADEADSDNEADPPE